MSTLYEILNLRENIVNNLDYLQNEFNLIDEILVDLNRIIILEMNHSMMFHWWHENEESINTITQLIENKKN